MGGRPIAFLWRDQHVRFTEWKDGVFSPPADFPLASTFPPGAVEGDGGELHLGVGEDQDANRRSRWRLHRVARKEDGSLEIRGSRWLAGEASGDAGNRRPNLVRDPEGRLHWISTGLVTPEGGNRACFYDEMMIGDASFRDGWLLKRYYNQWTQSSSAVAACGHEGDILLACRWFGGIDPSDNNLYVAHRGLGIGTGRMGDFDDVSHTANVGLAHSILWMARK